MKKVYLLFTLMTFSLVNLMAQSTFQPKSVLSNKQVYNAGSTLVLAPNNFFQPNLSGSGHGDHCMTDHLMDAYLDHYGIRAQFMNEVANMNLIAQQGLPGERIIYTIPIIFHVVYNPNNPAENVSNAAIMNLFNALNNDFTLANSDASNARAPFVPANVDVNFCLALRDPLNQPIAEPGVNRVSTTEDFYDPDTESNKMKANIANGGTGAQIWDRTKYVNVWICDITNGAGSGTAGYAYKPTTSSLPPSNIDGIVVDYNLGVNPANRVLTHEMGHFLGLAHTWGNSNSGLGCGSDDGLGDTPNTAGPSFNFPGSCSGNQSTCPPAQTQYENFMDYSNCQVMFTNQQAALMVAVLASSRVSLTTTNSCVAINPVPPVANFSASTLTFVAGGSTNFTDLSTNYPTSWAWTVAPAAGVTYIGGTTAASQNPIIQFANVGVYTVTLVATNSMGSDSEVKTNYINVVATGGGTIACDTLRNYTASEEANMTAYGITGESGYYPGMSSIGGGAFNVLEVAEKYITPSPTQVRGVYLPVFQVDDMGAAGNVVFKVYSHNTGTGLPQASLGTAHTMPLSALNEGFWNEIQFTTPISVSGTFWISVTFTYAGAMDTVILATTDFADRTPGAGSGTAAMFISGGVNWLLTSDAFNGDPNTSIVMDALTSNGPSPNAVMSANPTVACATTPVNLNGFGSTNTGSYLWYFDDGTNLYYSTQGNLNTTFTAGPWSIELNAQGSCQTDTDVLNITINPALTASYTSTPENCVADDGSLLFTVGGGDGSGYNYSINNGASFQTGSSFTGLSSGTYNVTINDGSNCEIESTATVANQNTFNPTITPDVTIDLGNDTILVATGGVSWSWFEGTINIGTTSSVTVQPTVTTTYFVYIVDANGCESNLEVTVTVDISNGVEDTDFANSLKVYPNPSTGLLTIKGDFNKNHDLKVEVLDVIGKQVMSRNWQTGTAMSQTLDLTSMAEGMYILRFTMENEVHSVKINIVR